MRRALYNLGVMLYGLGITIASPFHTKAKQWIAGRRHWAHGLKKVRQPGQSWIWFHCASLGEFEQGRKLLESIRENYPRHKIILAFFSPSGYEIRKDYKGADLVCYLPLDRPANVKRFLDLLQPAAVFFIKYEIWVNYLLELRARKIPAFLVSSLVRPGSRFLKGYFSPLFKEAFSSFKIIFTQNEETKKLLGEFTTQPQVIVSGDTRFDRVLEIKNKFEPVPGIEEFKGNDFCIVCGSTWPADEQIIFKLIEETKNLPLKWIIAPHEIHPEKLKSITEKHPNQILKYSDSRIQNPESRILLIDTIGALSRLYHYADFAFVGGAFGKGVHNTLEPAVYGNPVIFGPKYQRSDETVEMIKMGTAFSVANYPELKKVFDDLFGDRQKLDRLRKRNGDYVQQNAGATAKIMNEVKAFLD